jgi:hypothetical protein
VIAADLNDLKSIHDFASLVAYLHGRLDWPLEYEDIDDLTFDYEPKELGLEPQYVVKLRSIKQLRPLTSSQPWGIFYLEFEPKRLPVVVLRRILRELVPKKRHSAAASERAVWQKHDLLFISAMGEQSHRRISFAHFADVPDGQSVLQTFDWDEHETQFYAIGLSIEKLKWPDNEADTEKWRETWASAFTKPHRYSITTARELSLALAELAGRTRDIVKAIYAVEEKEGPLHALYAAFQKALVHDLTPAGFADTIAQTIAYGLFAARAETGPLLGLQNLADMIPHTNPFLRELFREIERLGGTKDGQINFDELGVVALIEMLNKADMGLVLEDFGRQTGGGREDPVIHFYELFLGQYDRQQKVERGVFYTPKPVVSFIVRSVDTLLREEFGLADGLADTSTWADVVARFPDVQIPEGTAPETPFVQILDPAVGTGTFLETVIEVIYETLTHKWNAQRLTQEQRLAAWNEYVPNHLLPRLYGFELMMASYAIAHVKIGLALKQRGYDFQTGVRLRVYLTNTLSEPSDQAESDLFAQWLSDEAHAAREVKQDTPIIACLGNPPYAIQSQNLSPQARAWVNAYRFLDGEPIKERNMLQFEKNIQNDYVKFVRFGQHQIQKTGYGILLFVNSHGYLDSPSFRGMRRSLMQSFDNQYILDLHGNSDKKEKPPNGGEDKNVFDIQTGVVINIFVKRPRVQVSGTTIWHADLWGSRDYKYSVMETTDVNTIEWTLLTPESPHYLFIPQDMTLREEYHAGWSLPDIMPMNSMGIKTSRDHVVIDFDTQPILDRARLFRDSTSSNADVCRSLDIPQKMGWNISEARRMLKQEQDLERHITWVLHRPFDYRHIFYHPSLVFSRAYPTMRHLLIGDNLGLVTSRQTRDEWGAFCTKAVTTHKSVAAYDCNSMFPLYLYGANEPTTALLDENEGVIGRHVNLSTSFVDEFATRLGLRFIPDATGDLDQTFGPEDIFNYMFAVFYAPKYRIRYEEFLRSDFPRLPLTSNVSLFRALCTLGEQLVSLHLMERTGPNMAGFPVAGSNIVDAPHYTEPGRGALEGRIWINRTQYFNPVPPEVWEFHIGGYQVCHKWLKDRKGRTLSPEDISHYGRVVAALDETIRLMAAIDEIIEAHGGWPIG